VSDDPVKAAEEFWRQWFALLPTISAALGDRELHRVENDLCEAVARLHPDLHFSVERGQRSIYALVITGQEDPELRPYTDAWTKAAPPDDAIWEYHDSVPPVPDPTEVTVNIGGNPISLKDFRVSFTVAEDDRSVDVLIYHPSLKDLEESAQTALTFLPLDAALGERLAADHLRKVDLAETEPEDSLDLLQFRDKVRELAQRYVGGDH